MRDQGPGTGAQLRDFPAFFKHENRSIRLGRTDCDLPVPGPRSLVPGATP